MRIPTPTAVAWVMVLFLADLQAQTCEILAKSCKGKTEYVIDRDPDEGTGTACGCPCNSATWMGIKGIYYTPKDGSIWYNFPCDAGSYKVGIHYQGDSDGKASFKIYVAGKEIGAGTIGKSSGTQTFGPVCVKKGDEIKVWLKSDYSTGADNGKHGNYGRFDKLIFTKSGTCGGTVSVPTSTGKAIGLNFNSEGVAFSVPINAGDVIVVRDIHGSELGRFPVGATGVFPALPLLNGRGLHAVTLLREGRTLETQYRLLLR